MLMLAENMHFFVAYFLGENSKFGIETSHTVRDNRWFTEKGLNLFQILYLKNKIWLIQSFCHPKMAD